MENTEKDWREALRDLANKLMEVEEKGSLEDLKIRCGEIFEALVILQHQHKQEGVADKTFGAEEALGDDEVLDDDEVLGTDQIESILKIEMEPSQKVSEEYVEPSATEEAGPTIAQSGPTIEQSGLTAKEETAGLRSESEGQMKSEKKLKKKEKREHKEQEEEYPTLSDLFVPTFGEIKEDMSQKEEFKDTVSLEETENLFTTPREEARQLSLNDKLVGNSIHFGLNDRIAFVNKLFNFSQSDFTKVVDRLNGMKSFQEANHYIQYQVKKSYNWKGKEDLEERFMEIVERKFMG